MAEHKYNNQLLQIKLRIWLYFDDTSILSSKEMILSVIDNINLFTSMYAI
jgi:hypothetical protein